MRAISYLLALLLAAQLIGCHAKPLPPMMIGERKDAVSPEQYEQRLRRIESLAEDGREQEALEAAELEMKEWPPDWVRRRLQKVAVEARRTLFYRRHPLHLSLSLDRDRFAFDETATVRLRISNLGDRSVSLPRSYRSIADALLFRSAETSVLLLKVVREDADGLGSQWSSEVVEEVPIDRDLLLAAGGAEEIVASVDIGPAGSALTRRLRVSAVYRPIVIATSQGQRRYDPLQFPIASVRVFKRDEFHLADGGLMRLGDSLEPDAASRAEPVFVTALGLKEQDLPQGVELLARAAPALDAVRSRAAVAALDEITGAALGQDPVRWLDWWESAGRRLSASELARRAGLTESGEPGNLHLGGR